MIIVVAILVAIVIFAQMKTSGSGIPDNNKRIARSTSTDGSTIFVVVQILPQRENGVSVYGQKRYGQVQWYRITYCESWCQVVDWNDSMNQWEQKPHPVRYLDEGTIAHMIRLLDMPI